MLLLAVQEWTVAFQGKNHALDAENGGLRVGRLRCEAFGDMACSVLAAEQNDVARVDCFFKLTDSNLGLIS